MATSGRRAQEAIRAKGSKKCSKHYGKEVIYYCTNCEDLVCENCVKQQHKGHELEGLSNVIPRAKQKLQDFMNKIEGAQIPLVKEKIKRVDDDLTKSKQEFQNQVSQLKRRNKLVKNELDKITNNMVKTCHDMENQNADILINLQKELQSQLDKLSSKIQEVKATLQSGNDVLMYDTSRVISSESEDLPVPSCKTAEFIPNELPLQQLEHLLGELNITNLYQASSLLSQSVNWRVMSEFTPYKEHFVKSMHAEGNKAWISFLKLDSLYSKTMMSVNQEGQTPQTMNMDVYVTDFCLSPKTGNIWYCSGFDNGVKELTGTKAQVKFITDTFPQCICVTRDDQVLIGCYGRIEKYTETGEKICTSSGATPPVVIQPYHISACPLTKNVALVDGDSRNHGGNGKPFVSILNDQLQLLHTYRGEVSGQQPPPRPFSPWDLCYTDTGELVITDQNNMSVVLVTRIGRYIQTLYTDSKSQPKAVSVHSGALWVSFYNGKVQVLRNN